MAITIAFSRGEHLLEDRNGDALDSVIAAMATFRAIKTMSSYTIEGYVYV